MFFPERIKSIKEGDRVLEVGLGGTPFHRSDVLLEKSFDDDEAAEQRGYAPSLMTDKEVVYFDGGRFPFSDGEFDYVICSHVLEHVQDVEFFVSELCRIARAGYIEFPTIYYDYIYNIPKHVTMLMYKESESVIYYMPKHATGLGIAKDIQEFFFRTTFKGYISLIDQLKMFMFQGFEWAGSVQTVKSSSFSDLLYDLDNITIPEYFPPSLTCQCKTLALAKMGEIKSKLWRFIHARPRL